MPEDEPTLIELRDRLRRLKSDLLCVDLGNPSKRALAHYHLVLAGLDTAMSHLDILQEES